MLALLNELTDEFGDAHLFRPYRDARFSKDKTPLKDHQGAVVQIEDAIAYYVQVSASGCRVCQSSRTVSMALRDPIHGAEA